MSDRAEERRLALLIEYDGTAFSGLQAQREPRTVQGEMERALESLTGERRRISFAGRTDAGVHARGQVGSFTTAVDHDSETWRAGLNHFLPEDVAVREVREVAADFDPRGDALSRRYGYVIEYGHGRRPLTRHRAWQRQYALDVRLMADAAATLPRDERDWAAFGGPVSDDYSTVRSLFDCAVRSVAGRDGVQAAEITFEASGFLPHQVRRMAGALESVGAGRIDVDEFASLIDGAPGSAGPTAPPQGLTLEGIGYAADAVTWASDRAVAGERAL
jgi:tRNA pseudouridine38-40 synthase